MSNIIMHTCPTCCIPLLYKCGSKNKAYYSHKPSSNNSTCRYLKKENETHFRAKQLIYEILLHRKHTIHLSRQCRKCSGNFLFEITLVCNENELRFPTIELK